jgi:hypothetical protein
MKGRLLLHSLKISLFAAAVFLSGVTLTAPVMAQNSEGIEVLDAGAAEAALTPPSADAQMLASLLVPRDIFIASNVNSFEQTFPIMAAKDPNLANLIRAYPGVDAAMIATGKGELMKILSSEYPGLADQVAVFVAQRYSPAEIKEFIRFYSTPAGKKLIRAEYGSIDPKEMLAAFTDKDRKLTMDEVQKMEANAASLGSDLTSAEKIASTKFFLGPVGRKIAQNKAGFQELTVNWVNNLLAKYQGQLSEASGKTIMDFITAADAKAGKK